MKNKKLSFLSLVGLAILIFGIQSVFAAPTDTPPSPNAPDATFNSITAINSTIPKVDILEAFCRIMNFGANNSDPDSFTMVSNSSPCTIKFNKVAADNKTNCENLGGIFANGTRECSWNKDQEFSNTVFCMMAGSPNPYVSNNACIWSSVVANFKGGIKVSGPIQNENYNNPIKLSNLGGFQIYAREPEKNIYVKVHEEYGKNGEIGYTDGVTGGNDGLSILAPKGIQLFSFSKVKPQMNLSISSSFYGLTGKYSNLIASYNEQSKNTPVMFEGIDVDAIYNSGVGGSGLLDKDGQSVGIRTNGHRAGIIATVNKQLGDATQSSTYTLFGQSFAGAGIFASGPSSVKNAGAGLFVGTGSSVNTRLAFSDSTGKIWAMNANGDIRVNGNATKTTGGASWTVASDSRLKNVKENFSRGLDDLMQVNPIVFKYKKDNVLGLNSDSENVGVIAQEVQKVIPEAVDMNDSGYLTVNNDPIIWTMLNSIKELKKENDKLQKDNADLMKRVEILEEKLK